MSRDPRHIVMCGTRVDTRGGIAAVIAAWRSAGLFERWPVAYIATHRDGTRLAKALTAARGFLALVGQALRHPRAVLHVHAASNASFWRKAVFMAIGLALRWPVIFHLHGGGFAHFHARCSPLERRAIRFFLDHAAAIVVVSERWGAWMRETTRNPRIVCIPNPVALPAEQGGGAREAALVVFSGRCEPAKGIHDLLDAVAALRPVCPRLRVECAGDGDLGALKRRAAGLGIAAQVTMRGWIGPRERAALLERAAVFVMPSHAEGMPMSLLEAMAAGCPVIASAVGGIPDLVSHDVNGLLVPPRDPVALAEALRTLLRDPRRAARLGREARATIARRHTAEQALERLEQLYAGLGVQRGAPRRAVHAPRLQEMS
jgi:glycosyltransferase involved in cell wall biosynthesis